MLYDIATVHFRKVKETLLYDKVRSSKKWSILIVPERSETNNMDCAEVWREILDSFQ